MFTENKRPVKSSSDSFRWNDNQFLTIDKALLNVDLTGKM